MLSTVFQALISGFGKTLLLFLLTLAGAIPLALLFCAASRSRFMPLKWLMSGFIWVIRGTPLMLQLIVIFYGPGLLFDYPLWGGSATGRMSAAAVAFIINYACYFSEIYRGGIESISPGQYEAGTVLGLTKTQIFFKVILVQVIKRILPSMANEIITLVKDTSLSRIIAVYEIIYEGERFIKSKGIIWPLFFTGVFYLLFSGLLTILFRWLEKKMSHFN